MALSDNLKGAALMTAAMVAFTVNDTFMKAATVDLPVFQAIVLRGMMTTLALLVIGWRAGSLTLALAPADRLWLGLRTFGEVAGTFAFLIALRHMPLANLSAILQFLPLAVTLAAAALLREPVGWRRMTAIMVGFVGVMLIVRPGTGGFDRWSVLGLLTVACVVIRDLATRKISSGLPSATVAFLAALSVTIGALAVLPFIELAPVGVASFLKVAGAAAFLIVGYLTVVMTMRVGDISLVAPFRYTSLVAAILLGWAVFGEFPDRLTLIGSAIVVATGIYMFHRERLLARRSALAA
jgi:drug/metabolite transporter (DMT)-like permease